MSSLFTLICTKHVIFGLTAVSVNLGFGFIRGIDTKKRLFYVVTPVPPEQMQLVNCLTMGAVALPTGIIGSQSKDTNQHENSKVYLKRGFVFSRKYGSRE